MSRNRFGRNQKRKLREQIAERDRRIDHLVRRCEELFNELAPARHALEEARETLGEMHLSLAPGRRHFSSSPARLRLPLYRPPAITSTDREDLSVVSRDVLEMVRFYITHRVEQEKARRLIHVELAVEDERSGVLRYGYCVSPDGLRHAPFAVVAQIRRRLDLQLDKAMKELVEAWRKGFTE